LDLLNVSEQASGGRRRQRNVRMIQRRPWLRCCEVVALCGFAAGLAE
jgi:hypothetical protein